jgi:type II secretory pathway pseudopilin PulG
MTGKRQESGFALLIVFAMLSIVAITMYVALPRVAFESERDKEQLLIDRGEQYSRAIQLYVRKTKRFPGKIEDLENTNGIRFLRKRYIDPMTGKGEWRIIHAGPGGALIDSLVQKQPTKKDAPVVDNTITELPTFGPTQTDVSTNPALRRRPSEQGGVPGNPSGPIPPDPTGATGTLASGPTAANPNLPGRVNPITIPGQNPGQPTAASGGISILPTFGGPAPAPNQSPLPGQVPPAVQQQINNPTGQFPGGGGGGAAPTNAGALIQNLLTTPRPGGLAGLQGVQPQGQTLGGGIAGVASNFKGTGVKLYHDQDEVPKWEFVYDVAKDVSVNPAAAVPPAAAAPGTPIGGTTPAGAPPAQSPGQGQIPAPPLTPVPPPK